MLIDRQLYMFALYVRMFTCLHNYTYVDMIVCILPLMRVCEMLHSSHRVSCEDPMLRVSADSAMASSTHDDVMAGSPATARQRQINKN